jgi:hypothetical protein
VTLEKQKIRKELSALVGIFFIVGSAIAFLTASYLSKGSIQYFFSFHGSDGPAGYPDSVVPTRLGVHLFGDYLLPRWQSRLSSPWFIDDPANGPINNYLPFTMAFFWVFSHFDYWRSFVVYLGVPVVGIFWVMWKSFDNETTVDRLRLLISTVILTAPFVSLVDRGNVQLYVIWFCCLGVYLLNTNRAMSGAVALGLAIGLKGYPVFFLALWIRARRWKESVVAVVVAGLSTLVPLLFYEGGVVRNLQRSFRNVRLNMDLYAVDSLAYNNSLRGTLLALGKVAPWPIDALAVRMYNHFTLIVICLAVVGVILMANKSLDNFSVALVACVMMTCLVDYVGGYAVAVYFVALVAMLNTTITLKTWRVRAICVLLAIQLMPKGFPLRFWSEDPNGPVATYTSLAGGTASALILAIIIWECIANRWARGDLNPHVLTNTGT